jgi:Anthranilate phosphoribosyltransferase
MVKRPILATMEKILQPIRAQNGNLLVTGYTHPAYKQMLSTILKEHNASPTSLLVRGLEGSAQLPIDRQAPILTITKNKIQDEFVRPEDYRVPEIGFSKDDNHFTEQRCMDEGLLALQNKSGPIRNLIAYNAAVILSKFSIMDKRSTIPAIQENLKNMRALEAFENG